MSFLFLIMWNVYNYLVQWFSDFSVHQKYLRYLLFDTNNTLFLGSDSTELKLKPYNLHSNQTTIILKWVSSQEHWPDFTPSHFTIWICWVLVRPLTYAYSPILIQSINSPPLSYFQSWTKIENMIEEES